MILVIPQTAKRKKRRDANTNSNIESITLDHAGKKQKIRLATGKKVGSHLPIVTDEEKKLSDRHIKVWIVHQSFVWIGCQMDIVKSHVFIV